MIATYIAQLDRIAVTAAFRYDYRNRYQQAEALADFIRDATAAQIHHVTTDPDVGRHAVKFELDNNFNLDGWLDDREGTDNVMLDAILEARRQGYGDEAIMDAIRESLRASQDDGSDHSYLVWSPLAEEEFPLTRHSGEVNGRQVPDVFRALATGLDTAEVSDAFRDADYPMRPSAISNFLKDLDKTEIDIYVEIQYGDQGWAGYFKPAEFRRELALAGTPGQPSAHFERTLNPQHGTFNGNRQLEKPETPVPHAREQLLRHLLRYAR